jgi:hypothetical protein
MAFTLAGPVAVVIVTLRSRADKERIARRVVHIEIWGLAVSCPFAVLGLLAIAAAAMM